MRLREQTEHQILSDVRVLVFVDKNVLEPPLVFGEHRVIPPQELDHLQDQVAEVRRIKPFEPFLILLVEFVALAVERIPFGFRHVVGKPALVLPSVNNRQKLSGRPPFGVNVRFRDQLLVKSQLIIGVQYGEVGFQTDQFSLAPQDLCADRMKRSKPRENPRAEMQISAHALAHLVRGFVREGDSEDFRRPGALRVQNMRHSGRQCPRFSGAGPGENQNRAINRLNRFQLRLIQPLEVRLRLSVDALAASIFCQMCIHGKPHIAALSRIEAGVPHTFQLSPALAFAPQSVYGETLEVDGRFGHLS